MADTKTLSITGTIPLPADHFDAASIVHGVREAIRNAETAISEALGNEFKFSADIVTPKAARKPRAANGTGSGRGRRAAAQGDGGTAGAAAH